jgi:hypothetical protein
VIFEELPPSDPDDVVPDGELLALLPDEVVGPPLTTDADEVLFVEVWYPKSSTKMVMVDASQMTIRLMSPSEAFGVDALAGDACRESQAFDAVRPGSRTAEEHLSLCQVGNPTPQCDQLRQATSRRP